MKNDSDLVAVDYSSTLKLDQQLDFKKYKYALENSGIGVWEYNLATNKVCHSKESKAIYCYPELQLDMEQADWQNRIHPDDLDQLTLLVNDHIAGKTPEYRSEHRILCGNGLYKWILDCGKIVDYDEDGNPSRFIGTTTDITQRKENEERLMHSLSIITNQNKKLTNFAHIVTHNLKEHAGNLESLLNFYSDTFDEKEKTDIITHLRTVSESLSNTITNLKQIVTKQLDRKLICKRLNLNACIHKIESLLDLEIKETKAIIHNCISDDLWLFSNEAYLESIILNLASNALKYAHPDRTPIITISSIINTEEIQIIIEDNGLGIDLEKHGESIFGLYNTFHGNANAEGIGLYITKNQIEALGGSISVKSLVNLGTAFTIRIKLRKC